MVVLIFWSPLQIFLPLLGLLKQWHWIQGADSLLQSLRVMEVVQNKTLDILDETVDLLDIDTLFLTAY